MCLFFYVLFVFEFIILFYLCAHTCPYRLAWLGTSLRVRGQLTIKEERIYSFMTLYTLLMINLCRILTAPVGRVWRLIAFSRRYAPKNTIRLPSLLITTAQE